MLKYLSKISPNLPKYPLDDISFINFLTRSVTNKLIS